MTIRLSQDEYWEQFQAGDETYLHWDAADELDTTYNFSAQFNDGWQRRVFLRDGIFLRIQQSRRYEKVLVDYPEKEFPAIRCTFTIEGLGHKLIAFKPSDVVVPHTPGKYYLRSNGTHPQDTDVFETHKSSLLMFEISPEVFCSFAASSDGELPQHFRHLVKPSSQEIYIHSRDTQPVMAMALQQILHCPYQGTVKRAYLESKVIELMALVLDHEVAIQQGETKQKKLRPEQLERIYYAREILLRDMNNPPSLSGLAHQVGLNEFTLKQGFRQTFGNTVFGELRSQRLEIAKQLLTEQDASVAETAHLVGYACVRSFAKAFKRKFGLGPKAYQKACR